MMLICTDVCIVCSSKVKEIEKRDSVLTPKQQIDRLLRPGSSYFNLNPFEVLNIDPTTDVDEIKKKYRRVSCEIACSSCTDEIHGIYLLL